MNWNLNDYVGKQVKVYLRGGLTLKGTLDKWYVGEDFRGKFYEYVVKGNNGTIRRFAKIDVINIDIK